MREVLARGLPQLGVVPEAMAPLEQFAGLLLEKNQVMNLTAITDPADVMTLHFLDSAALLPTGPWGEESSSTWEPGRGFPAWSCGFWTPPSV